MTSKSSTTAKGAVPDAPKPQQRPHSDPAAEPIQEQPKNQTVGSVVKHFRERRNMSQRDLSKAMGHSSPEWTSMIEIGARKLDIDRVPRLAQILQISPKDLAMLAFAQYYPATYRALFSNTKPGLPGEQETPVTLPPEAYELAMLVEALPPHDREVVVTVAKALAKNNRSSMTVKRG